MARIPGFATNITGASGTAAALTAKSGWRAFVFPRGAYAASDSTGTLITFDSADVISGFTVGDWIQAGLTVANIRQVGSIGGNSLNVSGAALTVSENTRIYLIGSSEPTVTGGSATYTPRTTIRQRDDDAADVYTNSMITSNSDGLIQGFCGTGVYDVLVQDGNQTNQGSIIDMVVGVPEGISVSDASIFGATATFNGAVIFGATVTMSGSLGITGSLTVGNSITAKNIGGVRYADQFSGADWGLKVNAAIADLPSTGGTVDTESLNGTQAIGTTLTITRDFVTLRIGQVSLTANQGIVVGATSGFSVLARGGTMSTLTRGAAYAGTLINVSGVMNGCEITGLNVDNNATGHTSILFAGGCADINVHHNRFPNQGSGAVVATLSVASLNKRVSICDNYIESASSTQNIRAIDGSNPGDFLRVNRNTIVKAGAISINQSSAGPDAQSQIEVHSNMFQGVDSSNILIRPVSGGTYSMTDVSVCHNMFEDAGLTLGKGFIVVGENAGVAGPPVFRRCVVSGNIGRGFGNTAGSGIGISVAGSANVADAGEVVVCDNIVDGRQKDGTQQNSSYGIYSVGSVRNTSIHDNIVRNTGRSGITIEDTSFATVHDNVIELAVQYSGATSPAPDQMGGIQVQTGVTQCVLHDNKILNPGVSGGSSHGIFVRNNSTNNVIIIRNNECVDDRGSTIMIHGVSIGATVANVYMSGQRTTGALLADAVQPITAATNTIRPHADIWRLDPSNDFIMTSAPTLSNGYDGQIVRLINVDGGTYTIALQDQGTLASSNLRLSGATIGIGPRDNITLMFDSTVGDWVQIGQVNVI